MGTLTHAKHTPHRPRGEISLITKLAVFAILSVAARALPTPAECDVLSQACFATFCSQTDPCTPVDMCKCLPSAAQCVYAAGCGADEAFHDHCKTAAETSRCSLELSCNLDCPSLREFCVNTFVSESGNCSNLAEAAECINGAGCNDYEAQEHCQRVARDLDCGPEVCQQPPRNCTEVRDRCFGNTSSFSSPCHHIQHATQCVHRNRCDHDPAISLMCYAEADAQSCQVTACEPRPEKHPRECQKILDECADNIINDTAATCDMINATRECVIAAAPDCSQVEGIVSQCIAAASATGICTEPNTVCGYVNCTDREIKCADEANLEEDTFTCIGLGKWYECVEREPQCETHEVLGVCLGMAKQGGCDQQQCGMEPRRHNCKEAARKCEEASCGAGVPRCECLAETARCVYGAGCGTDVSVQKKCDEAVALAGCPAQVCDRDCKAIQGSCAARFFSEASPSCVGIEKTMECIAKAGCHDKKVGKKCFETAAGANLTCSEEGRVCEQGHHEHRCEKVLEECAKGFDSKRPCHSLQLATECVTRNGCAEVKAYLECAGAADGYGCSHEVCDPLGQPRCEAAECWEAVEECTRGIIGAGAPTCQTLRQVRECVLQRAPNCGTAKVVDYCAVNAVPLGCNLEETCGYADCTEVREHCVKRIVGEGGVLTCAALEAVRECVEKHAGCDTAGTDAECVELARQQECSLEACGLKLPEKEKSCKEALRECEHRECKPGMPECKCVEHVAQCVYASGCGTDVVSQGTCTREAHGHSCNSEKVCEKDCKKVREQCEHMAGRELTGCRRLESVMECMEGAGCADRREVERCEQEAHEGKCAMEKAVCGKKPQVCAEVVRECLRGFDGEKPCHSLRAATDCVVRNGCDDAMSLLECEAIADAEGCSIAVCDPKSPPEPAECQEIMGGCVASVINNQTVTCELLSETRACIFQAAPGCLNQLVVGECVEAAENATCSNMAEVCGFVNCTELMGSCVERHIGGRVPTCAAIEHVYKCVSSQPLCDSSELFGTCLAKSAERGCKPETCGMEPRKRNCAAEVRKCQEKACTEGMDACQCVEATAQCVYGTGCGADPHVQHTCTEAAERNSCPDAVCKKDCKAVAEACVKSQHSGPPGCGDIEVAMECLAAAGCADHEVKKKCAEATKRENCAEGHAVCHKKEPKCADVVAECVKGMDEKRPCHSLRAATDCAVRNGCDDPMSYLECRGMADSFGCAADVCDPRSPRDPPECDVALHEVCIPKFIDPDNVTCDTLAETKDCVLENGRGCLNQKIVAECTAVAGPLNCSLESSCGFKNCTAKQEFCYSLFIGGHQPSCRSTKLMFDCIKSDYMCDSHELLEQCLSTSTLLKCDADICGFAPKHTDCSEELHKCQRSCPPELSSCECLSHTATCMFSAGCGAVPEVQEQCTFAAISNVCSSDSCVKDCEEVLLRCTAPLNSSSATCVDLENAVKCANNAGCMQAEFISQCSAKSNDLDCADGSFICNPPNLKTCGAITPSCYGSFKKHEPCHSLRSATECVYRNGCADDVDSLIKCELAADNFGCAISVCDSDSISEPTECSQILESCTKLRESTRFGHSKKRKECDKLHSISECVSAYAPECVNDKLVKECVEVALPHHCSLSKTCNFVDCVERHDNCFDEYVGTSNITCGSLDAAFQCITEKSVCTTGTTLAECQKWSSLLGCESFVCSVVIESSSSAEYNPCLQWSQSGDCVADPRCQWCGTAGCMRTTYNGLCDVEFCGGYPQNDTISVNGDTVCPISRVFSSSLEVVTYVSLGDGQMMKSLCLVFEVISNASVYGQLDSNVAAFTVNGYNETASGEPALTPSFSDDLSVAVTDIGLLPLTVDLRPYVNWGISYVGVKFSRQCPTLVLHKLSDKGGKRASAGDTFIRSSESNSSNWTSSPFTVATLTLTNYSVCGDGSVTGEEECELGDFCDNCTCDEGFVSYPATSGCRCNTSLAVQDGKFVSPPVLKKKNSNSSTISMTVVLPQTYPLRFSAAATIADKSSGPIVLSDGSQNISLYDDGCQITGTGTWLISTLVSSGHPVITTSDKYYSLEFSIQVSWSETTSLGNRTIKAMLRFELLVSRTVSVDSVVGFLDTGLYWAFSFRGFPVINADGTIAVQIGIQTMAKESGTDIVKDRFLLDGFSSTAVSSISNASFVSADDTQRWSINVIVKKDACSFGENDQASFKFELIHTADGATTWNNITVPLDSENWCAGINNATVLLQSKQETFSNDSYNVKSSYFFANGYAHVMVSVIAMQGLGLQSVTLESAAVYGSATSFSPNELVVYNSSASVDTDWDVAIEACPSPSNQSCYSLALPASQILQTGTLTIESTVSVTLNSKRKAAELPQMVAVGSNIAILKRAHGAEATPMKNSQQQIVIKYRIPTSMIVTLCTLIAMSLSILAATIWVYRTSRIEH